MDKKIKAKNYYDIYSILEKYFKEKYGVEISPIYEKSNEYVFIIPLHKISRISGKDCEEIYKEISSFLPFSFTLDNCFLRVSYNTQLFYEISLPLLTTSKDLILIEFSSPNIAKPFNVGHLRSTILGDSLSRLLEKAGYRIFKLVYFGDWGVQFGKLIYAYKKYGNEERLKKEGIKYLFELYVRIHKEENDNKEIALKGEQEFIKLEKGDKENITLWKKFYEISIKEFNKIYDLFDISFDKYDGESKQVKKAHELISLLTSQGIAKRDEKDGSIVLPTPKGNLVIFKKGERTLYSTRDLASIKERYEKYHPKKIIYVVGNEQKEYFEKVFYAAKEHNLCDCELIHIDFGLMYLPEGKFSTRKGNVVFVEDFLEFLALKISREFKKRGKEIDKKTSIKMAINTIRFALLSQSRRKNFMFDMEKFINLNNKNAIYLLYSYARINSLLEKYKEKGMVFNKNILNKAREEIENQKISHSLMNYIYKYPFYFKKSVDNYDPHYLIIYIIELCEQYNSLYQNIRFIGNKEFENAGLYITHLVKLILEEVFSITGITPISKI